MKIKRKEIILSLVLAVLIPGIVFFAVDKIVNKDGGEVIKTVDDVAPGEKITATVSDGKLICTVDRRMKTRKRGEG